MHTDLSPHLHSEHCNELIQLLRDCHVQNPFGKFFGACNVADSQMVRCLKEERLLRRKRNFEKSKETKERLRKLWQDERPKSQESA